MEPETRNLPHESDEDDDEDDLFGDAPDQDMDDEQAFAKLMVDGRAKELMAKLMEQDNQAAKPIVPEGQEEHTNRESKGFHSEDSEEEKDAVKRRSDLQDHREDTAQYKEAGQEMLFKQQVTKFQEKKLETQRRIKEFLESTFDPVIFASISRLFAVEMMSYHQSVFESVCTEEGITAIMSVMNYEEMQFMFSVKQLSEDLAREGCYNEQIQLLRISCLFWKEFLLKKETQVKNIYRGSQGIGKTGDKLYAFEVVSFLYAVLFFQGFPVRTGFLLSFDKLNLDAKYKLDMYSSGSNLEKPKKPTQLAKERRKTKSSKRSEESDSDDAEEYDSAEELSEGESGSEASKDGSSMKKFRRIKLKGKSRRRTSSSVERDANSVASSNENDKAMYEYGPLKGLMSRSRIT